MNFIYTNYREFEGDKESRPHSDLCDVCNKPGSTMLKFMNKWGIVTMCTACMHKCISESQKLSQKMFRGEIKNGEGTHIE